MAKRCLSLGSCICYSGHPAMFSLSQLRHYSAYALQCLRRNPTRHNKTVILMEYISWVTITSSGWWDESDGITLRGGESATAAVTWQCQQRIQNFQKKEGGGVRLTNQKIDINQWFFSANIWGLVTLNLQSAFYSIKYHTFGNFDRCLSNLVLEGEMCQHRLTTPPPFGSGTERLNVHCKIMMRWLYNADLQYCMIGGSIMPWKLTSFRDSWHSWLILSFWCLINNHEHW